MPEIIVTGCNGFIGTHIVESLLTWQRNKGEKLAQMRFSTADRWDAKMSEGVKVFGVDRLESNDRFQARRFAGSARFKFVSHLDLAQKLDSGEIKPVAVIHNGACSTTTETDPKVFQELNLSYSQMLFEQCAKLNVPLIYASSAAVYGDGKSGFSDSLDASSSFQALNLYGKSKLDFDLWALQQKERPPSCYGLRYFNVYGPFENHKGGQASMAYHGYQQVTRKTQISLFRSNSDQYPDGGQLRDFVYVKDIVKVTLFLLDKSLDALEAKASGDQNLAFLNVGTGQARSWNDLAKAVFAALHMPEKIEYIPLPENLSKQYQNYTCADLATLRSLGYNDSFVTLEDGVREYVQRYLTRGL